MFPQLEKVYDPKNEEDDMMEMEEERLRMREYFMKNVGLLRAVELASCGGSDGKVHLSAAGGRQQGPCG